MVTNPLRTLQECGQSVWLDSLSRDLIRSGRLARLISEDGITGVTANPSIFEKAIVGTNDYDVTIRELGSQGYSPLRTYEEMAIQDVGTAADMLRGAYDACSGCDGFASIEVSPDFAYDTAASLAEARRFWRELHRPNVMVKIPATEAGIPAIEELTSEGINVNITLIFAVEMYEQVMNAYLKGLERRVEQGQPIDHIASVASFFVSRVDTLVDTLLEEHASHVDEARQAARKALAGKIAIANAKIAYEIFERVFESERFSRLAHHGGQVQRPLWASTGTKNPSYPDTLYVSSLIGARTVNTMPLDTIEAFRDHGAVDCQAVTQGRDEARHQLESLESEGINMKIVTAELIRDGVDKFCKALHALLDTIEQRKGILVRP
jgi:transaldolase